MSKYKIPIKFIEALNAYWFISNFKQTYLPLFSEEDIDIECASIGEILIEDFYKFIKDQSLVKKEFEEYEVPESFLFLIDALRSIQSIGEKWDINKERYFPENAVHATSELINSIIFDLKWLIKKQKTVNAQ